MKRPKTEEALPLITNVTNINLDMGEHWLTYIEIESQDKNAQELLDRRWEETTRPRFVRDMNEAKIDSIVTSKGMPPPAPHVHAICTDLLSDAEAYLKTVEEIHWTHIDNPDTRVVKVVEHMKDARARIMEGNRKCPPDPCAEKKMELIRSKLLPQLEELRRYLLLVLLQDEQAKIEEMASSASS
ncbi:hypothetical protein GC174_17520 [bacterium]|nr:hypothetical protein [bacterium]